MFKFNKLFSFVVIAIIVIMASLFVFPLKFNTTKDDPTFRHDTSSFESVKSQIKSKNEKYKNSQLAKDWSALKFDKIAGDLQNLKDKKLIQEHLMNINYLMSLGVSPEILNNPLFHSMLYSMGQKILNQNTFIYMQGRLYLNIINQLDRIPNQVYQLLTELRKSSDNEKLLEMVLESLILSKKIEYGYKKAHINMIKSEAQIQQALFLLDKYRDTEAKKEVTQLLYDSFSKYSALQKAFILKYLIHHQSDFKGSLRGLISQVAKNKDEVSFDAFLSAVNNLNLQGVYKSEIQWIEKHTESQFIKQIAKESLATLQYVGEQ